MLIEEFEMFVTISIMFIAAAACIMTFIIAAPRSVPVLVGQRWHMPGLGNILIVETNIQSSIVPSIKYQLSNGEFGYCTKQEVQYTGKLVPYSKHAQREIYINKILHSVRERNRKTTDSWEPYNPPPGWVKSRKDDIVYDAEIIEPKRSTGAKDNRKQNLSISKDDDFTRS